MARKITWSWYGLGCIGLLMLTKADIETLRNQNNNPIALEQCETIDAGIGRTIVYGKIANKTADMEFDLWIQVGRVVDGKTIGTQEEIIKALKPKKAEVFWIVIIDGIYSKGQIGHPVIKVKKNDVVIQAIVIRALKVVKD